MNPTKKDRPSNSYKTRMLFITLFLGILIILNTITALSGLLTQKSENPIFFELSAPRLILYFLIVILSSSLLVFLFQWHFKKGDFFKNAQRRWHDLLHLYHDLFWMLLFGFLLFLLATYPAYRMGEWQAHGSLLGPFFLFLFFSLWISISFIIISSNHWQISYLKDFVRSGLISKRDIGCLTVFTLFICLILLLFKFELITDAYYWNVAAVPILSQYSYLAFGLFFFFPVIQLIYPTKKKRSIHPAILLAIIFLVTNIFIQQQAITRNTLVETPLSGAINTIPRSDSLIYDLGGRQFINGFGIDFWPSNDKPLYNTYVGFLHFFMGNTYLDIMKLNVAVLSLIPIFLFLIGKSLDSTAVGLLFASAGLFFEITTFQSSGYISNIHWKILMPEPLGQLMVLIAAFGTIRWLNSSQQKKWLSLTSIALGIGTYIRPQILILSIALILILALQSGRGLKERFLSIGYSAATFLLITLPWIVFCRLQHGYIPLLSKFNWIQAYRFQLTSNSSNSIPHANGNLVLPVLEGSTAFNIFTGKIYLILAHFLNNIIKALLSLPYTLQMDSVPAIFKGIPYWNESSVWRGDVSLVFLFSLIIFCIGLIGLYRKDRLTGLVPLIYLILYFAALALSRTSGSRYLIPVIWVVYLYYFFGIILIARYLSALIFKIQPVENKIKQLISHTDTTKEKFASYYFTIPLILGLVLPIMDSSIPKNQSLALDNSQMEERLSQSIVHEQANLKSSQWDFLLQKGEIQYGYGELVYPEIKALENDPTLSMFRFNLVGSHPLVDLQFIISNLSADETSTIDLKQPYFVLTCKQKNSNVSIPFIMQTKDQQHLYVSKNNLETCQKLWLPLLNP